jgi:hypothetical protein
VAGLGRVRFGIISDTSAENLENFILKSIEKGSYGNN